MPSNKFTGIAVFDLETTGLSPSKHHRIIEIGVVRLDEDFEIVECWETLINPNRDVGASGIHGLTASDLTSAPFFEDVMADIWHRFEGTIPVSHNFYFDSSFITAEYRRHGIELDAFDGLCTLQLANKLGLAPGRRRLIDLCKSLSIDVLEAHSAGSDALMCAELLRIIAKEVDTPKLRSPVSCSELWRRQATPLGTTRQKVRQMPIQSPLQLLSERLGKISIDSSVDEGALEEYLVLLDGILEDRVINESEAEELAIYAAERGFGAGDIEKVHYRFVAHLVALSLSDGIVTEDELRDLRRVSSLLGVELSTVDQLLTAPPRFEEFTKEDLAGKCVCFTGELRCTIDGDAIDRDRAEAIASSKGLFPKPSVTKKLDLLVVADPESLSGKAKKAREYGIRIIAERAFLAKTWHPS